MLAINNLTTKPINTQDTLIVGRIPYLVCAPFFYQSLNGLSNTHFKEGTPSQLNTLLQTKHIDLAPCSSFEYALNHQNYTILPHISTSSFQKIQSVFLFSNLPWDQLHNKHICLSPASATSNILFQILSHEKYKVSPICIQQPKASSMGEVCIGDQSLKIAREENCKYKYQYDLAQEWHQWQHLPFTFGLWIVHKNCLPQKSNLLNTFYHHLLKSKNEFHQDTKKNITTWLQHFNLSFSVESMVSFLTNVNYNLTDTHKQSLRLFFTKCVKNGFLKEIPLFNFWKPNTL